MSDAMVTMELRRHYAPRGDYEIVGYTKEAVTDAKGNITAPETFVRGEMRPAPQAGVGFPGKIWAGTHIRLPADEARTLHKAGIAARGFDD